DSELLHRVASRVGSERHLATDPVSALAGDGPLGQFVTQPNFELRARKGRFCVAIWDEELPAFLADLVRGIFGYKRGRREDELQFRDTLQFFAQRLEREDRERRCSDAHS